jgi:protein-S-isoprenylcysteine O-methyltransferase Ste14
MQCAAADAYEKAARLTLCIFELQLQYKHVTHEHVPGSTNTWLTFMMPTAIVLLISLARRSLKEAHHAALAIWAGNQLNDVATSKLGMHRDLF